MSAVVEVDTAAAASPLSAEAAGAVYVENSGCRYKVSTLTDFKRFRDTVESTDGWKEHHSKDGITVWSRPPEIAPGEKPLGLDVVKMQIDMPLVPPHVLYDALHDADYRKSWDENMIEGYNICQLNPHNDIGYYAVKFPWPLSNRDFCNMRCWMEFTNGEFLIFNFSVPHADCPEKKEFVRGRSLMTGYYMKIHPNRTGTRMLYLTHTDLSGSIPYKIINMAMKVQAPSVMKNLTKRAEKYEAWKLEHGVSGIPSWRTPKMDWDSSENYPKAPGAAVSMTRGGGSTDELEGGAEGAAAAEGDAAVSRLYGEIEELKRKLFLAQQQSGGNGLSLAPVAPAADDCPAVQQYRALMNDAANYVDRQFIQEGRIPTTREYLTRFHSVVQGMNETPPTS